MALIKRTTVYRVIGSVRGTCGHNHRILRRAIECLVFDQAGCQAVGGYSDRCIQASDDNGRKWRALNVGERDEYASWL
ncbi:hypothetical protein LCGC14_1012490 [marine sediment metagenome]|uniref:Uncharacterized protein n=1 Tax=marine sediment metagenome TaxID=412755 RepID=A0A0F9R600_9ZZZZ